MKKLLLTLLLLFSLGFAATAKDVTFAAPTYQGETDSDSGVSYSYASNGGTNSTYANPLRVYFKNQLTFSSTSAKIQKIEFTTSSQSYNGTTLYITADGTSVTGTNVVNKNGTTVTITLPVAASTVEIVNGKQGDTNTQLRISKIVVSIEGNDVQGPSVTYTTSPKEYVLKEGSDAVNEVDYGTKVTFTAKNFANTPAIEVYHDENAAFDAEGTYTTTIDEETYVEIKDGETVIATYHFTPVAVAEKLEATFDFVNDYNTVFAGWPTGAVTDKQQDNTAVAGVVTLHATGRLTVFESTAAADKGTHTLRLYKGQGAAKAGAVELSVADGYYITGITITGASLNIIDYTEEFTNTDTSISSKTYTASNGTANIKTITVKYAPVPAATATEIVGLSYKLTGKSKAIVVDYTIHIKNHKDTDTYKLMLSVDGSEPIEITPEGTPALRAEGTPEAAPARVATGANASFEHPAEGATHDLAGTYTATIEEDKAAKHTVSLAVHLNDAETADHTADAVTIGTTTGIENVTVDAAEAAEYYTLQGIRVAEPQAGQVYIVRRGATATKELVK